MAVAIVAVVLAVWFAATCVAQLPCRLGRQLLAIDIVGLIPRWTFFAPTPGTSDYRIVFRDRTDQGWCPFRELPLHTGNGLARAIWNPDKLQVKVISDVAHMLLRDSLAVGRETRAVMLSWSYLVLLTYVVNQPSIERGTARQFAIVSSAGHSVPRSVRFLFLSEEHAF